MCILGGMGVCVRRISAQWFNEDEANVKWEDTGFWIFTAPIIYIVIHLYAYHSRNNISAV